MLAFLLKNKPNLPPISPELDEQLSRQILSYLSSEELVNVLPEVHPVLKRELTTTYADLSAIARERILIFQRTLSTSSFFANPDSFDYVKLSGGYSNTTYKLSRPSAKAYISRIAGVGSESIIDRKAEWHNATIAAELGLNPAILFNDQQGNQLSLCLPTPEALSPELLEKHPEYLNQLALQLRTLHQSPKKFHNELNIFSRNKDFYRRINDSGLSLPREYAPIRAKAEELEQLFARLSLPSVPCHNDTYYNNFLLSNGKLWLIDWEYSANHDPIWDLAYFSNLAHLNEAQNTLLLSHYFACPNYQERHALDYLRFIAYRLIINDFLILWTYMQVVNKNLVVPEAELLQWATNALKEGAELLSNEEFNQAVLLLETSQAQEEQSPALERKL